MIEHLKERYVAVVYERRRPESPPDVVGIGQVVVDGVLMRPLIVKSTDGGKSLFVTVEDAYVLPGTDYAQSFSLLHDPSGPGYPHRVREQIVRLITELAREEAGT